MAVLQHNQILKRLEEKIVPQIDISDISDIKGDAIGKRVHALSRAMAVAALKTLADVSDAQACNALVDGTKDNGIDLIYYDVNVKTLFLVQSKWNDKHTGSIDSAGILKFIQGVKDLVSLKSERFNSKVNARWPNLVDALDKLSSVILVLAYPGSGRIDDSILENINEFVDSQNDTSELFFFRCVSQKELFKFLAKEAAPSDIDLQIRLTH